MGGRQREEGKKEEREEGRKKGKKERRDRGTEGGKKRKREGREKFQNLPGVASGDPTEASERLQ